MQTQGEPDKDVPETLAKKERPEEVGGSHGDATGGWRILRNSMIVCVAVLAGALIVFNLAWT